MFLINWYDSLQPEDVQKLREENRRLIIDIQLMTRELDMYNNGQSEYTTCTQYG